MLILTPKRLKVRYSARANNARTKYGLPRNFRFNHGVAVKKILLIIFTSLGAYGYAYAANKCVGSDGKVTYQEQLCNGQLIKIAPGLQKMSSSSERIQDHASFLTISEGDLRKKVMDSAKDPDSVQFKNLYHVGAGRALCGQANAKNSYGGYVGYRAFVADDEGVYWAGDGSSAADIDVYHARRTFIPKYSFWKCPFGK